MAKPQGKYINVDDTGMGRIRRTVNKLRSDCDKQTTLKVWFFGGSTAWGKGAPDFATIPSYLSAKLNAQGGVCVELINLGVDAYNTNQELIYLTQQLKSGWRPEVVIFYDGYNDAAVGAFRPALPEAHFDYTEIKTKFESAIINWPGVAVRSHPLNLLRGIRYNLRGRHLPLYSQEEWISRARRTLDNYEFNLELARVLAKSYRFKVHFFWQPTSQYGTKPLDPFEKAERDLWPERQAIQAVYQEAERRSAASKSFIFLGRIFDQVAEPLYIDQVHLGPQGNEIVAGAIARVVCSTPPFSRGRQAPDARN
jgi:lysophospholipase L1-like esterase